MVPGPLSLNHDIPLACPPATTRTLSITTLIRTITGVNHDSLHATVCARMTFTYSPRHKPRPASQAAQRVPIRSLARCSLLLACDRLDSTLTNAPGHAISTAHRTAGEQAHAIILLPSTLETTTVNNCDPTLAATPNHDHSTIYINPATCYTICNQGAYDD